MEEKAPNESVKNITRVLFLFIATSVFLNFFGQNVRAQGKQRVVRMAKIEVDSAQLETYKTSLKEEIETSIQIEPGVITLYAVSEKNAPTHITIFETYADQAAYEAHLKRPHFLKYKAAVKDMIKHLDLVEVNAIILGGAPKH